MDLKGIGKLIGPLPVNTGERVNRAITSEKSNDREGNGQSFYSNKDQQHEPMSDEQYQKAVEHLRGLQVVKENQLQIEPTVFNGLRVLLLKESSGKIIRRIHESELWSLQAVRDHEKGQLLSKSA